MRRIIALIKTIALEIWGLFVDDIAFAAAVVAWLVAAGIASRYLPHAAWISIVFFAGLALLLAGGAIRQARRIKK